MPVCPPGFICLSNGVAAVITVFIFMVFYYMMTLVNSRQKEIVYRETEKIKTPPPERNYRTSLPQIESTGPFGTPINVKTRGQDSYQQVGVLYKTSAINTSSSVNTPGNNTNTSVLPLFGRRTYKGSNLWNYYTSTSDHSIVKLPIYIDGYNCTKDKGCQELQNGSTVNVDALNGTYKVDIYEYDSPKYIPFI